MSLFFNSLKDHAEYLCKVLVAFEQALDNKTEKLHIIRPTVSFQGEKIQGKALQLHRIM
jgi:hypothetical protein